MQGTQRILLSVGWIGLFLLAMIILTEGLRNVVGNSLWMSKWVESHRKI